MVDHFTARILVFRYTKGDATIVVDTKLVCRQ